MRNTLHTLLVRVLETNPTAWNQGHVTALQSVKRRKTRHTMQTKRRIAAHCGEQKSRHVRQASMEGNKQVGGSYIIRKTYIITYRWDGLSNTRCAGVTHPWVLGDRGQKRRAGVAHYVSGSGSATSLCHHWKRPKDPSYEPAAYTTRLDAIHIPSHSP